MPKVSAEHREQVRQRLLDAARAVVLRDGAEGATTRAILDEAGVSAGTLYNYFPSKEALFEALIQETLLGNVAVLAVVEDGLRGFVDSIFTTPDVPALAWFRGRMSTDPDRRATQARLNQYIVELFSGMVADEQAAGGLPADLDAPALVELLDIVHDGMNRRFAVGTFVTSYERVGAALRAVFDGALDPSQGAARP
jgi:AcrR family transcriptional regulator